MHSLISDTLLNPFTSFLAIPPWVQWPRCFKAYFSLLLSLNIDSSHRFVVLNRLIRCLILLYLPGRDYNHIYRLDYFERGFCRNPSVPCSCPCPCPPSLAIISWWNQLGSSRAVPGAVISILVMIFAGHYTFKQLSSGRNPKKKMRKKNKHSFDLNKCMSVQVCVQVCVCECVYASV